MPLALGALLSDWAYSRSQEVQWINFAAWLILGLLLFAGAALLWAVIDLLRADVRKGRRALYAAALLGAFLLGLLDALVHAKDGWATMPAGLILSSLLFLLVLVTVWMGFAIGRGEAHR